jgi:asparagine N-glycosylation enzyme membrane subunit Stt3
MTQQMFILVLPALAVVVGLILHSQHFRGKRDTLYFFLFAALFGIAGVLGVFLVGRALRSAWVGLIAAIFLALCYLLNRRDRFRRQNLESAAAIATAG